MIIMNCLHRGDIGGAQKRVVWVGRGLQDKGFSTIILFPKAENDVYETWLTNSGANYISFRMPVLRRFSSFIGNLLFFVSLPFYVLRIRMLCIKNRISLLHVNGVTNLQPILAGIILNKPVLWHWNDMLTPKWFISLVSPLLSFSNIRLVVATSEITNRYTNSLRTVAGIETLPAPVPPHFESSGQELISNDLKVNGRFVVGFIGNLLHAKGCFDYIECMHILCGREEDVYGVMVGGELPGHPGILQKLISLIEHYGLKERIEMVGFKSNVHPFLRRFDLLLFPSHTEACPITVLEAMDVGIPVVSYAVGEVPIMLVGTDLSTYKVGDKDGLVGEVLRLHASSHSDREQMGLRLKENAKKRYSLDAVVNQHARIYSEMLSNA